MPAALRITLRPPSHRRDTAPAATGRRTGSTSTPVSSCAKPVHLRSVIDPHRQLGDPGGHDPLDLVLQIPSEYGWTRREVGHVQHGSCRTSPPEPPDPPAREPISDPTLIEHLDRGASENRRPVSRRARDRDASLRPRRRPSPTPTQPPSIIPAEPPPGDHHSYARVYTTFRSSHFRRFRACGGRLCSTIRGLMNARVRYKFGSGRGAGEWNGRRDGSMLSPVRRACHGAAAERERWTSWASGSVTRQRGDAPLSPDARRKARPAFCLLGVCATTALGATYQVNFDR